MQITTCEIILVILRVTKIFFQQWPSIIGSIIVIVLGSQYELQGYHVLRFSEADSIVNNNDVELSEHLSW